MKGLGPGLGGSAGVSIRLGLGSGYQRSERRVADHVKRRLLPQRRQQGLGRVGRGLASSGLERGGARHLGATRPVHQPGARMQHALSACGLHSCEGALHSCGFRLARNRLTPPPFTTQRRRGGRPATTGHRARRGGGSPRQGHRVLAGHYPAVPRAGAGIHGGTGRAATSRERRWRGGEDVLRHAHWREHNWCRRAVVGHAEQGQSFSVKDCATSYFCVRIFRVTTLRGGIHRRFLKKAGSTARCNIRLFRTGGG